MAKDAKTLPNVSEAGLKALANVALAPKEQNRLDKLLHRNQTGELSSDEATELDLLIEQVDELNLIKARALYTLDVTAENRGS